MCGLFGVFGKGMNGTDHKIFYDGLSTIMLRGPHSTGIGWWDNKDPGIDWIKTNEQVFDFLRNKKVSEKLEKIKDPLILMGHVRWATKGVVASKNAHPFQHGHTLLAHNGTIHRIDGMDNFNKFEVDSDAAAWCMENWGLVKTLKAVNGPYVFTWMNDKERSFNLVRNWNRDLYYAKHPYRSVWYYSSEKKHLEWVITRNSQMNGNSMDKFSYENLPIETHLKYDFKEDEVELIKLDKELYPNFTPRTTEATKAVSSTGVRNGTEAGETTDVDSCDLEGRFQQFTLERQNKGHTAVETGNHPTVVELTPRRRSWGDFDGPKGNGADWLKKEFGVSSDDWIRVKLIEYSPYTKGRNEHLGKAVGEFESVEAPDVYINAHSIDINKPPFNKKFEPGWYAGKISAVSWVKEMESYAIHLNQYRKAEEMPNVKEPVKINPIVGASTKVNGVIVKPIVVRSPVGMTKTEFNELTPKGCSLCHNHLYHHKKENVFFVGKNKRPLCIGCLVMYRQNMGQTDAQISTRLEEMYVLREQEKSPSLIIH